MLRLGIIGCGKRGKSLIRDVFVNIDKVRVAGLCDVYEDKMDEVGEIVNAKHSYVPEKFSDWKALIDSDTVDTIVVTASWETHIDPAIYAMKKGKAVAIEVGGAYSVEECWELVRAYEETKTPFMMLENCCYGKRELMVTNMVEKGFFGEIVHCEGAYAHDLRNEISFGKENRHYRLRNYLNRNCENYPTHELGPIAKLLKINRGNRMVSLTSTASKAAGLKEYIKENKSDDEFLMNATFSQGDIITTVIKCANGETITLTLDTTLPRYYSRNFTVRGTKGMYEERTDSVFEDKAHEDKHFTWKEEFGNAEKYEEEYQHPIWKDYLEAGIVGGHDGMDWLVDNAFVDAVINGTECPIDVYDAASWMVISVLSEQSILKGGAPVEIPDFTRGEWIRRPYKLL